jgi:endonuclease YncB( thermonuclease family)
VRIHKTAIPDKKDYKGLVEFHGTVNLKQFYSLGGQSDADTIHLNTTSIRFRPRDDLPWIENIQVFDGAYVNVYGEKVKVIKNNKVKVRLQGIDATELHLQPKYAVKKSKLTTEQKRLWKSREYRQYWSVRSTTELAKFFKKHLKDDKRSEVNVYAYSRVDKPNDLFDKYARLVADIVIKKGSKNVNQWLVENGWVLPTFYETMTAEEISSLDNKAKSAENHSRGIWKDYSKNMVTPFDFDLFTLKKPPYIEPMSDKGKFVLPKIYRRQVNYEVNKRAKIIHDKSLKDYIKKGKDKCYEIEEFFIRGTDAKIHYLDEYISKEDKIRNLQPSDLIFTEASATLRDSKDEKIIKWQ